MSKITVALISGGVSSEREVSLAGGEQIYQALDHQKYDVLQYDPRADLAKIVQDAPRIDTALVILHGANGEDGTIQGFLDLLNIPYQCSGVLGSALAANKLASKRVYETAGLPVPPYVALSQHDPDLKGKLAQAVDTLGLPIVVKPVSGGSSIGMAIVADPVDLEAAVASAFAHDDTVLLEVCLKGVELTGGVLGNDSLTPLPVVEIIPGEQYAFFDYEAKYTPGATTEICPARIDEQLSRQVQDYACRAHRELFCKGCSRTDMIAVGDRLYLLETNTIPGMVPTSLLPLAAKAAGISFPALLDRLIELSLESRGKG
ncbi:MAG: D-alanine--D-alanine ligase [Thermodesulfobacteriota bacterium]|nr:D-alanine--D-alanine ligase [Thermodesulfobacteriota bacterium]